MDSDVKQENDGSPYEDQVAHARRHSVYSGAPAASSGGGHRGKKKRRPRDDEAEEASDGDSSLPMAGGGGGAAGAEDPGFRHVMLPLWRETFDMCRQEPVGPPDCFGCRHSKLGVMRLPYEQFNTLTNELPAMMIELGLYGACEWAGKHFADNVVPKIDAPPDVLRTIRWSGVSIVWHFCKHSFIAQFRLLIQIMELEDMYQRLVQTRLVAVPLFGDPDNDAFIDVATQKQLTSIALLLQRLRAADPKKMATFHPGVASGSAAQMQGRVFRETYTGSNILHN